MATVPLMSARVSLVTVMFALVCWEYPWFASHHVAAEQHDTTGDSLVPRAPLNETDPAWRYRADRYRDPFVPKPVVRDALHSPVPKQAADRQHVLVKGIVSSPWGRWALLEFENGERLIVSAGQVIEASSQVVTRITDHGVTLSTLEGTGETQSQSDRTYFLDREQGMVNDLPVE